MIAQRIIEFLTKRFVIHMWLSMFSRALRHFLYNRVRRSLVVESSCPSLTSFFSSRLALKLFETLEHGACAPGCACNDLSGSHPSTMVFEFSLHWLVQQLSDAPAWTQANKSRLERGFAFNHCARTLLAYLKCATAPHAGWWPLTLSYSDSPCVLMQMSLGFQGRAFSPICQNPRSQVKGFFDLEMRFIIMCFLTLVLEVFNGIQSTLLWLTDRSWGLGGSLSWSNRVW